MRPSLYLQTPETYNSCYIQEPEGVKTCPFYPQVNLRQRSTFWGCAVMQVPRKAIEEVRQQCRGHHRPQRGVCHRRDLPKGQRRRQGSRQKTGC